LQQRKQKVKHLSVINTVYSQQISNSKGCSSAWFNS